MTLAGSNLYTGTTTFGAGVVNVANTGALNSTGNLSFAGGTLQYSSSNSVDYSSRFANSTGTISIDTNGQNVTYASGIAGTNVNGFTKLGTGTLTLAGADLYTGRTTIAAGVLNLANANAINSVVPVSLGGITFTGGTLQYSASNTVDFGARIVNSTSAINIDTNGQNVTYASISVIGATNVAGLTKLGAGTLTLNANDLYTGVTTLAAGTINISGASSLSSGNVTFTGGTLQYGTGIGTDYSAKIVNSSSAIAIDTNSQSVTYASAIAASNSGGLLKLGVGTLTLDGTDAYTGATVINAGTVATNNASGLSSGAVDLNNGSTLQFLASGFTFANNVVLGTGGGTMSTTSGGGVTSLTGTFSGGTGLTIVAPSGSNGLSGGFNVNTTTTSNLGTLNLIGNGTPTNQNRLLFGGSSTNYGFVANATINVSNAYLFDLNGNVTLTNSINLGTSAVLEARSNTTAILTNVTLPASGTITIGADDVASTNSFTLSNSTGTLTTLTGNLTISTNPYILAPAAPRRSPLTALSPAAAPSD